MKSIRLSVLYLITALLTLVACDPIPPTFLVRDWTWNAAIIVLNPTGLPGPSDDPGDVILLPSTSCPSTALGCVKFSKNDTGTITFALVGSPDVKTCSDTGVQKVITKIEFTDEVDGSDTEKGDFYATAANPLPAVVKTEAITVLDIESGEAYAKADHTEGETRVTLINVNGPGAVDSSGKVLWYRVTISRCSDGEIWMADPRLVNDGMDGY
jgi:hypothetical protein